MSTDNLEQRFDEAMAETFPQGVQNLHITVGSPENGPEQVIEEVIKALRMIRSGDFTVLSDADLEDLEEEEMLQA